MSQNLAALFHKDIDPRGYHARDPIEDPKIGDQVVVPVWHRGDVIGYATGRITDVKGGSEDPFWIVAIPGRRDAGYFRYSLAKA